jgi:glycosyltransferase involved in cell wall biosynthesis
MKLKILMLSTSLGLGGGDKEVIAIASNLIGRGHEVKMISMVPPGIMGLEAHSRGIDVSSLNMSPGFPNPRVIPKLISSIRKWQPDILHSHMVHANLLARLVRVFTGVPVQISTAQNIDESEGQAWREIAYKATDFLSDLTTNVSKIGVERYIKDGLISKGKAIFIPNSVDINKFYPNKDLRKLTRIELGLEDRFTWLAVGRFYPQKDYDTMIEGFSSALKKYPHALLMIAGEGILQPEIENKVKTLGIEANVKFLGPRRDIPALMNAADAHLMSSSYEGMPLVLLEAAATGLPVVATDVGGVKETVLSGKSGILVPPQNPEVLANAICKLMEIPHGERLEMGKIGREYAIANYSTDEVVTKWEKLYLELLNKQAI